jgi:colanic acid biosynthesis glycosyl transferase WcaI
VPRNPLHAAQRIIYDISFAISAFLIGLTIRKIDTVLAISPPLEGGLSSYILTKIKRARFVLQIKDVVPDLAISLNILKNRISIELARAMEKFVYKKASVILVICQGFIDNIKSKGVSSSKLVLLSNWVDMKRIKPLDGDNPFRGAQNLKEKFLVLHSGNMGAKQKLENVIEAARCLQDLGDVLFLLAGDGPQREYLKGMARGLPNVKFLSLQPKDAFPYMLSAADVLVLNQSASVMDMVLPYKLLNYMSAGRPIVASVNQDSETARYMRWADCGFIVPPEQPQKLAEAVLGIYSDRKLGNRFGQNGRTFAEKNFDQAKIFKEYLDFFEKS